MKRISSKRNLNLKRRRMRMMIKSKIPNQRKLRGIAKKVPQAKRKNKKRRVKIKRKRKKRKRRKKRKNKRRRRRRKKRRKIKRKRKRKKKARARARKTDKPIKSFPYYKSILKTLDHVLIKVIKAFFEISLSSNQFPPVLINHIISLSLFFLLSPFCWGES